MHKNQLWKHNVKLRKFMRDNNLSAEEVAKIFYCDVSEVKHWIDNKAKIDRIYFEFLCLKIGMPVPGKVPDFLRKKMVQEYIEKRSLPEPVEISTIGTTKRRLSKDEKSELVRLFKAGVSYRKLAVQLQVSTTTIVKRMKKLGLLRKSQK
jgi:DNA invertase Pin-like site-specific DNA recombinase